MRRSPLTNPVEVSSDDSHPALVVVVSARQQREVITGAETHLQPRCAALVVIGSIRQVAIVIDRLGGQAGGGGIAQRHIQRTVELTQSVVAEIELCVAAEFPAGLAGDQVDRASGGIAAVQCALGSLENLDALEVIEQPAGAGGTRDINTVQVQGNCRVGQGIPVEVTYTAQVEKRERPGSGRQLYRRNEGSEVLYARNTLGLELLG
jgi:hypothetical protein